MFAGTRTQALRKNQFKPEITFGLQPRRFGRCRIPLACEQIQAGVSPFVFQHDQGLPHRHAVAVANPDFLDNAAFEVLYALAVVGHFHHPGGDDSASQRDAAQQQTADAKGEGNHQQSKANKTPTLIGGYGLRWS